MANKKKLEKSIGSLEEQIRKHKDKIRAGGSKDTTIDYWEKEIQKFEEEIKKRKEKLH